MHMIKQDQSKVHNMDLLWRYYEKNRNFGKAAHVLARLADMHRLDFPSMSERMVDGGGSQLGGALCETPFLVPCSTEISLKQRLEYMARAILSAKSSSSISAQASDGEFLHELEEKMEVRLAFRWLKAAPQLKLSGKKKSLIRASKPFSLRGFSKFRCFNDQFFILQYFPQVSS